MQMAVHELGGCFPTGIISGRGHDKVLLPSFNQETFCVSPFGVALCIDYDFFVLFREFVTLFVVFSPYILCAKMT